MPGIEWRADGTPFSPHFGDIYRSEDGLRQARHVFLRGCGLLAEEGETPAWSGMPRWGVLELGFGLGLNFLATWHAWQSAPQRPARLFYSACEAWVPTFADLRRSAAPHPELLPLLEELETHWHGLAPGVHRLRLAGGQVLLTLAVGDVADVLPELDGVHDSLFLDGFAPEKNPAMWQPQVLRAAARLLHLGARAATWCVAGEVRRTLEGCGFEVQRVPGLPPKRHALRATYAPRWTPRQRPAAPRAARAARCAIVGAGLAGAACAWELAKRGWSVTVLDAAARPAAGASGLPVGAMSEHVSFDDDPAAQLTRAGLRATRHAARTLLVEGEDWRGCGTLERYASGERRLPPAWDEWGKENNPAHPGVWDTAAPITQEKAQLAGVPLGEAAGHGEEALTGALWHAHGGWLRPVQLMRAMLAAPGVQWKGGQRATRLEQTGAVWRVLDDAGKALAEAELLILCAGFDTRALLPDGALPLQALRGQAVWGATTPAAAALPFPVTGHGGLIAGVPLDAPDGSNPPCGWYSGSTFARDDEDCTPRAADHAAALTRLRGLHPAAANAIAPQWETGEAQAWAGIRAVLPDHLPAVGAWMDDSAAHAPDAPLPLHLLCGLGVRGITMSVLAAEIIAAQLHAEPLPIARSLAAKLRASRWRRA